MTSTDTLRLHSQRRSHRGSVFVALLTTLLLGGCGDEPDGVSGEPNTLTYGSALDVDLSAMEQTPSGLYRRDLAPGSGEPIAAGQMATVHYTAWLPNGAQFDGSRGGDPFSFGIGRGEVIQGWDEGIAGMQVGGRRQLVIPPALAYGPAGAGGVIPPNATLVFEVELLAID